MVSAHAQSLTEDGRAHKAGVQMIAVFRHQLPQAPSLSRRILRQAEDQGQGCRGLGPDAANGLFVKILLPQRPQDLPGKLPVVRRLREFQDLRRLRRDLCAAEIVGAGDEERIGGAEGAGLGIVQSQPVGKMEAVLDQVLSADGFLPPPLAVHPGLHARVALPQQFSAAVIPPDVPGDDHRRVRPGAGAVLPDHALLDAGHHVGHAAPQDALLGAHIPEVFPIESGHVQALAGGGGDSLGVAGPAQTLIPLGAVAGHVQKVVLHTPEGVLEEPVHRSAAGAQPYDLGHGTAQMHGGKVLRPDGMIAVHLHIAKAKEREVGTYLPRCSVGDIGKARDGRAVVVMVEFSVLQDLPRREGDARPLRQVTGEAHPAGQILPEVQNRIALGRADQLLHREAVTLHHRQGHPVLQFSAPLRGCQHHRADRLRPDARIPGFPVIDVGEADGRAQLLPALVRGCEQRVSLPQLRDGVEPLAVKIRIAALKAQTALEPAFAQGDDQAVLPLPQQR